MRALDLVLSARPCLTFPFTIRFNATKQVVEGNLIYVTSNYRLSVFGFLGYPGLSEDDTYNFAVLDQQVR